MDKPRDEVWNRLVAGLGEKFFVVNNLDKASGFINVSYTGDPEEYVDGGELYFKVSNLAGTREYRFPASRKFAEYETSQNGMLWFVRRNLNLDGRINIVVAEVSESKTRVTVNTRYVLTLSVNSQEVTQRSVLPHAETIAFNSGDQGSSTAGTQFRPTGRLEAAILELTNVSK